MSGANLTVGVADDELTAIGGNSLVNTRLISTRLEALVSSSSSSSDNYCFGNCHHERDHHQSDLEATLQVYICWYLLQYTTTTCNAHHKGMH